MQLLYNFEFWQFLATVAIPFALHHYTKQTAAITAITELREKSDALWDRIKQLSPDYSSLSPDERDLIARYLNEYEHFCRLYNYRIISRRVARIARRGTILDAYGRYFESFIAKWREDQGKPEAWLQLQRCAIRLGG